MEQFSREQEKYVDGFIGKRVIRTWSHFFIAVIFYFLLNCILGIQYPSKDILLSFFAWKSIGNSNWYIFDILSLYILFYIVMKISLCFGNDRKILPVFLIWTFNLILWVVLYCTKERYWYDTILAFSAGATYSYFKEYIDKKMSNLKVWIACLIVDGSIFSFFFLFVRGAIGISISSICFSILVVLITMRVSIYNQILDFLGKHLFSIYVFQRIPMIILDYFEVLNPMVFVSISFISTIIMSILFSYVFKCFDNRIFA